MELTPSQLTTATFSTVRKGYDRDEVDALLRDAAAALEAARQQATAMEARARAAVTRLQEHEAQQGARDGQPGVEGESDAPEIDEAAISRTLLLAQRTADTTVATAEAEAERILTEAREEADAALESSRDTAAQLVDEARVEARKASESERVAAANDVEALRARREFLLGDVDQLESFLVDQRERLRSAARDIESICDRVPSGLGPVASPAVSASDGDPGADTAELVVPPEARLPFADAEQLADALEDTPLTETLMGDEATGDEADDASAVTESGEASDRHAGPDTGELDATQALTADIWESGRSD